MIAYRIRIRFRDYEFGGVFYSQASLIKHLEDTPLYAMLHLSTVPPSQNYYDSQAGDQYEPCRISLHLLEIQKTLTTRNMSAENDYNFFPDSRIITITRELAISQASFYMPFTKGAIIGLVEQMLLEQSYVSQQEQLPPEPGLLRSHMDPLEENDIPDDTPVDPPTTEEHPPEPANDGIRRIERVLPPTQPEPEGEENA
jgi:hypothetical protein